MYIIEVVSGSFPLQDSDVKTIESTTPCKSKGYNGNSMSTNFSVDCSKKEVYDIVDAINRITNAGIISFYIDR